MIEPSLQTSLEKILILDSLEVQES
jgi:hypothetical protein